MESGEVRRRRCRQVRVSQGVQQEDPGVCTCHNMRLQEEQKRSRSGHLDNLPAPFHHVCTLTQCPRISHSCHKVSNVWRSRRGCGCSVFLHFLSPYTPFLNSLISAGQSTCAFSQRFHYKSTVLEFMPLVMSQRSFRCHVNPSRLYFLWLCEEVTQKSWM